MNTDFYLKKNTDFVAEILITNAKGIPVPVVDCKFDAWMRFTMSEKTFPLRVIRDRSDEGIVTLFMDRASTLRLREGDYLYSVELILRSGRTIPVANGKIVVAH